MPSLVLTTNVKIDDLPDFALHFSEFSAAVLKKPERYISVNITPDATLTFQGTLDPAFLLVVTSLDNITPELNEEYSKAFFKFFEEKLDIRDDRGYITFYDPGRAYLGYQGTTFAQYFSK